MKEADEMIIQENLKPKKKSILIAIIVSYFVFAFGWYIRESYIDFSFLNPYAEACVNFLIYGVWWSGFAFSLIYFFESKLNWNVKDLLRKKLNIKILLISLAAIFIYYFICWVVSDYKFNIEMNWLDYILTVIGVGIFEESIFRGWFYNAWSTIVKEKYANIISALMFVFIHYPRWFQLERALGDIIYGSVYVFILGILLGRLFRKNNHSVWLPAILHSVWDALGFLI